MSGSAGGGSAIRPSSGWRPGSRRRESGRRGHRSIRRSTALRRGAHRARRQRRPFAPVGSDPVKINARHPAPGLRHVQRQDRIRDRGTGRDMTEPTSKATSPRRIEPDRCPVRPAKKAFPAPLLNEPLRFSMRVLSREAGRMMTSAGAGVVDTSRTSSAAEATRRLTPNRVSGLTARPTSLVSWSVREDPLGVWPGNLRRTVRAGHEYFSRQGGSDAGPPGTTGAGRRGQPPTATSTSFPRNRRESRITIEALPVSFEVSMVKSRPSS